jgi:hypothetical protein
LQNGNSSYWNGNHGGNWVDCDFERLLLVVVMGEERKRRREKLVKDSVKNDIVLREYDNIVVLI